MSDNKEKEHTLIVGSGFLGSNLLARIMEKRHGKVTVIDTKDKQTFLHHPLVVDYKTSPDINYIWIDTNDSASLVKELEDEHIDNIVYTAAIADVPFAIKSPRRTTLANINNTLEFMEFLRMTDYEGKFIMTSSESIFGHQLPDKMPLKEEDIFPRPANIYGWSKFAQESLARMYYDCYGIKTTIMRSSTMYGPYGRVEQAIPDFVKSCLSGLPIVMTSDGSPTRDFNHVQNMVDAMELVFDADITKIAGETFNIGSGSEVRIMDLVKGIKFFLKSDSQITFGKQRPGEKGLRVAIDITKAREVLDYSPKINLFSEAGIGEVAIWIADWILMWPKSEVDKLRILVGKRLMSFTENLSTEDKVQIREEEEKKNTFVQNLKK